MESSGQLYELTTVLPGKECWYLLNRRLGGLQNQSRHSGKQKNFLPLPGLEPWIVYPMAYSPCRLCYPWYLILESCNNYYHHHHVYFCTVEEGKTVFNTQVMRLLKRCCSVGSLLGLLYCVVTSSEYSQYSYLNVCLMLLLKCVIICF